MCAKYLNIPLDAWNTHALQSFFALLLLFFFFLIVAPLGEKSRSQSHRGKRYMNTSLANLTNTLGTNTNKLGKLQDKQEGLQNPKSHKVFPALIFNYLRKAVKHKSCS